MGPGDERDAMDHPQSRAGSGAGRRRGGSIVALSSSQPEYNAEDRFYAIHIP